MECKYILSFRAGEERLWAYSMPLSGHAHHTYTLTTLTDGATLTGGVPHSGEDGATLTRGVPHSGRGNAVMSLSEVIATVILVE